jgi:hypothetical protein
LPAVQARMPAGGEVLQRFEDAGVDHQHGGDGDRRTSGAATFFTGRDSNQKNQSVGYSG